MQPDVARFLALVTRELGAHEVRVLEPAPEGEASGAAGEGGAAPSEDGRGAAASAADGREIRCTLPDGQVVVARFDAPQPDLDAKQRRLDMLASTFDVVVEEAAPPRSRPPAGRALHEELRGVCTRAGALNAVVIDANSPILWAAAKPRGIVPDAWCAAELPPQDEGAEGDAAAVAEASRSAIQAVRAVVDLAALRKGKRIRHLERDAPAPQLTHSFAGIYLLTLVFGGEFDELRAERAVLESIVRVERLVLALPPLDPPPGEGARAIAIRRPRRR